MPDRPSCLVTKLGHYISISEKDKERLVVIEKSERSYGAGAEIHSSGETSSELFVVKRGWLISSNVLPNGKRQIVKVHLPGDIIGFPDISQRYATSTTSAVEDVEVCPFPKSALDMILRESPRLSALMLTIALRDQVVFADLLRALGSMAARARLCYMLLDLAARLKVTNPNMEDSFRLPLSQSQIGDYLGLTNVYVSKSLMRMENDGMIARDGKTVRLLRPEEMSEACDFHNRYHEMDTSWFPGSHEQLHKMP
tara:strand:- start:828 stop:1589 length:762 start_codon:yes stop_codon:yes gene_type:complete